MRLCTALQTIREYFGGSLALVTVWVVKQLQDLRFRVFLTVKRIRLGSHQLVVQSHPSGSRRQTLLAQYLLHFLGQHVLARLLHHLEPVFPRGQGRGIDKVIQACLFEGIHFCGDKDHPLPCARQRLAHGLQRPPILRIVRIGRPTQMRE